MAVENLQLIPSHDRGRIIIVSAENKSYPASSPYATVGTVHSSLSRAKYGTFLFHFIGTHFVLSIISILIKKGRIFLSR